jgi:hypothetical protein
MPLEGDTIRAIRDAGGIADTLLVGDVQPGDFFGEYLLAGQEAMAAGRYFDAEERFVRALGIRPDDVTAQVGRAHAQLGAGLFVSAAMNLALVRDRLVDVADPEVAPALARISSQLSVASTELRRTVHGIAPMAFELGGVGAALEELALRSAIPVSVQITGDREPDLREQTTIYFMVAECLTNVAKHAGAARAHVALDLGESVRVIVSDDGSGGADPGLGTGLRGLADRIEATGMVFAGLSPDGVLPETVELPDHPWFIGVQYHPELKSRPFAPHPLFASFIAAAVKQSRLV